MVFNQGKMSDKKIYLVIISVLFIILGLSIYHYASTYRKLYKTLEWEDTNRPFLENLRSVFGPESPINCVPKTYYYKNTQEYLCLSPTDSDDLTTTIKEYEETSKKLENVRGAVIYYCNNGQNIDDKKCLEYTNKRNELSAKLTELDTSIEILVKKGL